MEPMKFLYSLFLISLVLCQSVFADNGQYRIGIIAPFSGDAASLGKYLKQGIEYGLESLPQEMQEKVLLIFEDDQLQATKTVSAYRKLRSLNQIDALIVAGSGSGHAVGPLAEKDGVVAVAIGASDKAVSSGKNFVFTHWISPEAETTLLCHEVAKRGYKRLAVVTSEQQGAIALEDALRAELKARHFDEYIVFSERFSPDTKDFRTALAKIRARKIDGIVATLLPGSLSSFAKQLREFKINADLFGYELFEDENEVKASDGALFGKWYVNADIADEGFRAKYQERFNEQPGFGVANSYDTIQILIKAVVEQGGDNSRIAHTLHTLKNYSGACGTYSATGDNRFDLPAALKIITNKGFEKLN